MPTFPAATAHGPIEQLADDLWCVRGTFRGGPGFVISRTMAIVRAPGGLVVVNSIRLRDDAALDALGKVAHVVKLSDAHGRDDAYYVGRYKPAFWSLSGAKHDGIARDRTLGPESPVAGGSVVVIPGTKVPEAALLVPQGGGALITCDAIQNCVDYEGLSLLMRLLAPLMGFSGGVIVPSMWKRFQGVPPARVAEAFAGVRAAQFDTLVPGHGPAVRGGAKDKVDTAIARATA
jgi:hypothetical protein